MKLFFLLALVPLVARAQFLLSMMSKRCCGGGITGFMGLFAQFLGRLVQLGGDMEE
jgi:hypothetical protein